MAIYIQDENGLIHQRLNTVFNETEGAYVVGSRKIYPGEKTKITIPSRFGKTELSGKIITPPKNKV